MNTYERKMVTLLKQMRDAHGAVGVKAEFEAEGTRFEELLRLKDVALRAAMGVALKIGGAEDVWGILQARRIGVSDIIAPMVESPYALLKYLEAVKKHIPEDERKDIGIAVNIETIDTHRYLSKFLSTGSWNGLDYVTIGRVDLVGSMHLSRSEIVSERVSSIVEDICRQARRYKFCRVTMGGGIESESFSFIKRLVGENLLDRFETRKVIFDAATIISSENAEEKYGAAVKDAHRFELLWLANKERHYGNIAREDATRILMLKQRVGDE